jgi:muramoyltetrapeptide carboxypeptidase
LFLKDLDEYLYHIDRMMQNLKKSGVLKMIKGLIVDGMIDMNDNSIPFGKTAEEIIAEAVKDYDYPFCFHFPAGRTHDNLPLIFGKVARLEVFF